MYHLITILVPLVRASDRWFNGYMWQYIVYMLIILLCSYKIRQVQNHLHSSESGGCATNCRILHCYTEYTGCTLVR